MPDKLVRSDYRLIAACLLVCAVSLFIGVRYFYRAFPEASIDFKVDRDTSLPLALKFLHQQEIGTDQYRHATSFRYDGDAKVFLERELGLQRANALMSGPVRVWRWGHRWFKPLQKEEIRVEVTPGGDVAGFDHVLPEDAPGADLSPEAARSLAESFLVLEMKRPIDTLEYLDSETQKRPNRTDHLFTWKVSGLDLRGATYRVTVTIQGDRVDGYGEYLRVPEEWSRSYARLRSLNEGASQVDLLFFALLGIGMVITLGHRIRLHDVRWKTAFVFGAIALVLQFLSSLNEYPVSQYDFDTTGTYASFVGRLLLFGILGAMSFGGIIFILTAAGEPLYRDSFREHLSISRMLSWASIRTKRFFRASLVGVTLAFFFFAYEIGFYLLANRFGAWAPADIPYTDLLNTRFPWVSVLLGGFFPAVSEEWVFRAFAIPFLALLFRRRWLAIVLASFVWGFGHANYPNQPFFIRGIEVGVVGLVLSWAMVRFGILAPLIAHYSIDAFYSAFLFLRSGNPYLMTTGAVTAGINLIPLFIAAGAFVWTRTFRSDAPVTNAAEEIPPPVLDEPTREVLREAPAYTGLSTRKTWIAFGLLALGTLLLALRPPRFGDFVKFRTSVGRAAQASNDFLTGLGFDTSRFLHSTHAVSRVDYAAAQYVYRAGGVEALNRIYGSLTRPIAWQTRYFVPLQKEEFQVNIDPADGRVISFSHDLPEEAAGPDLREKDAQKLASSFLSRQGYDLSLYTLKETRSDKPRQRRDTTFTWEARSGTEGAIGEARFRVEAGVFGDKVGLWTNFIKTPEDWNRTREREGIYGLFAAGIRIAFIGTMFAFAFLTLLRAMRRGQIRWRLAGTIGLAAMALELVNAINSIPEFYFDYDTQVGMQVAIIGGLIQNLLAVIGIGLAATFATGLVLACYPDAPLLLRREARTAWSRDAVTASLASLGLIMLVQRAAAVIEFRGSRLGLVPTISPPEGVGTYLPILSNLRDIAISTLFFSAVLAFAVHLWGRTRNTWVKLALLAGLLASFLPDNARRLSEAALDLIPSVLLVAFAASVVVFFLRTNYLGYVFSGAVVAVARTSSSLLGHGNLALTIQGWILWGGLLAALVITILRAPKPGPVNNQTPSLGI